MLNRAATGKGFARYTLLILLSTLCLSLVFVAQPILGYAAQVKVAWDPSPSPDVTGYKLYLGNASRNYTSHIDVGNQTSYTLTNLDEGKTYYIAATSYDSRGNESTFSEELIVNIPSSPRASFPFREDFESGTLADYWTTNSTGSGRVLVTSANGPHSGSYHLTMDSSRSGSYSLNELILTIDLQGQSGVMLGFWHKEFKDEDNVMPSSFTGSYNADGVAVSEDGVHWYKVQGLTATDGISSGWTHFEINLDDVVNSAGIQYTSNFKIKFQQYDNYPIATDGFAFDDIEIFQGQIDADHDGMPDDWETSYFGTLDQSPNADYDQDGLTNAAELQQGTDPTSADTDGDGMPDGWEVKYGLNPLDPADAYADIDGDGIANIDEFNAGTNPIAATATFPFVEDFESGKLASYWTVHSTGAGRILVTSANGPQTGSYHVTMDSATKGVYSLNELILSIDLQGRSGVMLGFWHKEFSDEDNAMPDAFTGSYKADGVAVSADGVHWYKVQGLTSSDGIGSGWKYFEVNLDKVLADAGIQYTSNFQIKFQQYDNYPISTDGFAFDNIEVFQGVTDDDHDGMPDDWEITYFGSLVQTADGDYDHDGLTNVSEWRQGTDPTNPDTDGDGMPDGWEVTYNLNPLDPMDANMDADGDGVTNLDEFYAGTNPVAVTAPFPFVEDFESGTLASYWTTHSTGAGRIQVTSAYDAASGSYHLTMDSSTKGTYSLNELILTINLQGRSGVTLSFWHKEFKDENNVMPDSFTGSYNADGVAISADGVHWYKVQGLTSADGISSNWKHFVVNLDEAIARAGIQYSSSFKIKFQQYDNYPISYDGFAFDDIELY